MSIKLQEELRSSDTHFLYTFLESEGLYPNHMHTFRPLRKYLQRFKKVGKKLYEELRSQGTDCLYTFMESKAENDEIHEAESGKN